MSTARARPFHPAAWALGVLALILLYFLSFPIVRWTVLASDSPAFTETRWVVVLVDAYEFPYLWLRQRPPLDQFLEAYSDWWWVRLSPPSRKRWGQ
jgi:hypothetical protein